MKNVVQSIKKFRKNAAIELRKKGLSYSEIQKKVKAPRSTLSLWLKGVELSSEQLRRLTDKRLKIAKENSAKRILKTAKLIEEIKFTSSHDVKKISKRELWLMGVILYWRERLASRSETDLKNGVRFSSSDPELIRFFIKWLKEIGRIKIDEIKFDLFLKKNENLSEETIKKAVIFWSDKTGFPRNYFLNHVYFQKENRNNTNADGFGNGKRKNKNEHGFLRIRVRSSSMLARQIAGWVKGVLREL
jgi:hypothetical protein